MKKQYVYARSHGDVQAIFSILDRITEVTERIANHMKKEMTINDKKAVIGSRRQFA